ncbi:hypothetical protein M422DRAFT_188522, partial [Sphaerobolus stellatus SS14]
WMVIKQHHWIPQQDKTEPGHAPGDSLSMCPTHHRLFDRYNSFYTLPPHYKQIHKFVFVNYLGAHSLQQLYGKAVALDINHCHASFPSVFIIHEMCVHGFNPFQPITPDMPNTIHWKDWILLDSRFDNASTSFIHDHLPANNYEASLG